MEAGPAHTYSGTWGEKTKKGFVNKKSSKFIYSKAAQYIAYIDVL
jgi:hypothetical protein